MKACLYVGLGGAVGSIMRYLVGLIRLNTTSGFPYKTLAINLAGAFLIGLIAAAAERRTDFDPGLVLFLKGGVCVGFTTFSTFAIVSTDLIQSGKMGLAILYMCLSVVLSVLAVAAAQSCIK